MRSKALRLFSALIMAAFVFAAGQGAVSAAPDDEGDSAISVTVEIPESDTTDPDPDPTPDPDPSPDPDPDDGDKTPPADLDPDAGSDELPRTGFSAGTVLWVAFALVVAGAATRLGITAFRRQDAR